MRSATSVGASSSAFARVDSARALGRSLDHVRRAFQEHPALAMVEARRCHDLASADRVDAISARALALQGAVSVHRGDLDAGLEMALQATVHAERSSDVTAQAEVAALKAQLGYFTGAYAQAMADARLALALADATGDLALRLFVHRSTCAVFGNLGTADLRMRLEAGLALAVAAEDRREQALSHNDVATMLAALGDVVAAGRELERAFALLGTDPESRFALACLHVTRAEVRLASGEPIAALLDGESALQVLTEERLYNPYLLGAAAHTEVQALIALGKIEAAQRLGEGALDALGGRLPQTRGLILSALADGLHNAGRLEEAYSALSRASALDREALRELERRSLALEQLQEQLRDQAHRDWLTGLHNRRFLARQVEQFERGLFQRQFSLAVVDIDRFKRINDLLGHSSGDLVLVQVARLLEGLARRRDTVVRSGGDEFLVLMPDVDEHLAVERCEQIRRRIWEHPWHEIAPGLVVTASVGAAWTDAPQELRAAISVADHRLYRAKRGGRDQVMARNE
jgi:two-component system, cell cycle response regulator